MKLIKNLSFRVKILIILILFFIVPFTVVFILSYTFSERIIYKNASQATDQTIEQLKTNVYNVVETSEKAASIILYDRKIEMLLYNYLNYDLTSIDTNINEVKYSKFLIAKEFDRTFYSIMQTSLSEGSKIAVISADHSVFSTWSSHYWDYELIMHLNLLDNDIRKPFYIGPHESFNPIDKQQYFSYIRKIYDFEKKGMYLGTLIISIPIDKIKTLLENSKIAEISNILLLDSSDEIFINVSNNNYINNDFFDKLSLNSYSEKTGSFTLKVDGDNYLINYDTIEPLNFKLVSILPHKLMFAEVHQLRTTILTLSIIILVTFTFISFFGIHLLTKPLYQLKKLMEQVKSGNLDVTIKDPGTNDEIGVLYATLKVMLYEIRQLIEKIKDDKNKESQMRFELLMSQINPHFLFNTLNSIKWMAIIGRADNISNTITALGRLLEISMNKQSDIITLSEEIENVKSYVLIQKARYKNFNMIYDIDQSIMDCQTPKLILQPMVENAIIHNIIDDLKLVEIQIIGVRTGDNVKLIVKDNGSGIPKEELEKIFLTKQEQPASGVFKGIGVLNVDERLKIKYGSDFGVSIKSIIDEGTTVEILFPYVT